MVHLFSGHYTSSVRVPVPWILRTATFPRKLKTVDGSDPGPGRNKWKNRSGNRGPKALRALNPPGIGTGAGLQPWDAPEEDETLSSPRANGFKPR